MLKNVSNEFSTLPNPKWKSWKQAYSSKGSEKRHRINLRYNLHVHTVLIAAKREIVCVEGEISHGSGVIQAKLYNPSRCFCFVQADFVVALRDEAIAMNAPDPLCHV